MDVIKRYIVGEFAGAFLFALGIFTLVFTVGNLIPVADFIINKGANIFSVLKLFGLLIPSLLTYTVPSSILLGTLLAFGRLAADSEMQAMLYSGMNLRRLTMPVIILAFAISMFCALVNDRIATEFGFEQRRMVKEIGVRNPRALIEPGVFTRFGGYIIFAYGAEKDRLKNVRVYLPKEGQPTRTVVAESVEIDFEKEKNVIHLKMRDGTSQEQSPTDPNLFYNLNFKNYEMTVNIDDIVKSSQIQKKIREKTIMELASDIRTLGSVKGDHLELRLCQIEIHKKIALAASCLVFVLVGMPLAIKIHRREKVTSFGVGLVVFGVYWGLFLTGLVLGENGTIPPWLGAWMANIIVGCFGIFLFWRISKR